MPLRAIAVFCLAFAGPAWSATTLLDAYNLALESDPVYRAAAASNRAAQEGPVQARGAFLPTVGLRLSTVGTEREIRENDRNFRARPSFNTDELTLSVTQPVYRKDLLIGLDQAGLVVRRANVEYASERQSLMTRTATAYFAVLEALDTVSFAEATREAFGQQLRQSQQRFEVGLIAITDVEEAQAGFDRARADVIAARNGVDTALEALREVTGEYHESLALLSDTVPLASPEPNDIDAWTQTALEQNLALHAARLTTDTAAGEIKRVQAGHLPTVDLVGTHNRNHIGGGALNGSSREWNSTIGLQVQVPIYQGGIVLSRTRQARHQHQESLEVLERARRNAQRQTRDAFLGVQSGISRVDALTQAVRSAESAKNAIEAGFQVGTRTSVDVLDADREVFRAKRDLASARYGYILDTLRLKQAAGTLSEADLVAISTWLQ